MSRANYFLFVVPINSSFKASSAAESTFRSPEEIAFVEEMTELLEDQKGGSYLGSDGERYDDIRLANFNGDGTMGESVRREWNNLSRVMGKTLV